MSERPAFVRCDECACISDTAPGWVAYLAPDPDGVEPTDVVIVCPVCAEQEFGHVAWHHYT